jgi:hypothetical protein
MLGKIILNWAEAHQQDWSSLKYWDQATAEAWQNQTNRGHLINGNKKGS